MLTIEWPTLMDELKIEVLTKLIKTTGFPRTLLQASLTSREFNAFAKDFTIWHQALRVFLPILEHTHHEQFSNAPFALFKKFYIAFNNIMSNTKVKMADYINMIVGDWGVIPLEKKDILIALAIMLGFEQKIKQEDINIQVKSWALLFASTLGFRAQVVRLLALNDPAISPEFVRIGLQCAAEEGHLMVFAHYLSAAGARLDANSKRSALIRASANGFVHIVNLLMQRPEYLQGAIFALRKSLSIACENGHVDVVVKLMSDLRIQSESNTIRQAIITAYDANHRAVVATILQNASDHMNANTITSLFKKAVINGDADIIALLFERANQHITDSMILESLRQLVLHGHEQAIKMILEKRYHTLSPYFKRQLFLDASKKGFVSVVSLFLEHNDLAINETFKGQAFRAAAQNKRIEVVRLLLERAGDDIPTYDKMAFAHSDASAESEVATLTQAFANFSLKAPNKENVSAFTPGYKSLRLSTDAPKADGFPILKEKKKAHL